MYVIEPRSNNEFLVTYSGEVIGEAGCVEGAKEIISLHKLTSGVPVDQKLH
jgi:hypothetical protein